jgi:hypothetical protein
MNGYYNREPPEVVYSFDPAMAIVRDQPKTAFQSRRQTFFMRIFKLFLSAWLCLAICYQSVGQEEVAPSSISNKLGVTGFNIQKTAESERTILLHAERVNVNDQSINLDGKIYKVSKYENQLEIDEDLSEGNKQGIRYDGESFSYFKDENITILSDENLEKLEPTELNSVIILVNILKEADVHFDDNDIVFGQQYKASIKSTFCDRVVVSIGAGQSITAWKCKNSSDAFLKSHSDCYKAGDCDTSCFYENHLCFATAFFYCNGKSCDWF